MDNPKHFLDKLKNTSLKVEIQHKKLYTCEYSAKPVIIETELNKPVISKKHYKMKLQNNEEK